LVSINETSENDHLNEARVKFITSQDKIAARILYQEFFDFDPSHKTFLTTNHKPIIRGTDIGIWRRIHLLPFTVAILPEKVETDFRERRLMPELSGILNWALAGLAAYLKQRLNPPEKVLASTKEYREDMDVVGQWIAERCEVDLKASVPTGEAYFDYSQWAEDEVGWALKKLTFRRHLTDRGFTAVKGAQGRRMIGGLRLKSTSPTTQTAADVGEQTVGDDTLDKRIKNLIAPPPRSGDCPTRRWSAMSLGSKESD
jgi:putative DNA primase/helicase